MKHFLRSAIFVLCLFLANIAHSQAGIKTPTYHFDTVLLTWKGKTKHKMREGEWTAKDRIFNSTAKATYVNGKLNGPWTVHSANGELQEEGNYVDNLRDGKWVKYSNPGDTSLF